MRRHLRQLEFKYDHFYLSEFLVEAVEKALGWAWFNAAKSQ